MQELELKLNAFLRSDDTLDPLSHDEVYRGEVKRTSDAVGIFTGDEDLRTAMGAWIQKGKFGKLLDTWVRGAVVDWAILHRGPTPRTMTLPVYPFARQRLWNALAAHTSQTEVRAIHPLLHRNTSTLEGQRYTTRFTGREFVLAQHRMAGIHVLPGSACMEMVRAAVLDAHGGTDTGIIHLTDISWPHPFTIESHSKLLHLGLHSGEADEIDFEIYAGSEQESSAGQGEIPVYCRGGARFLPSEADSRLDLAALKARCQGAELDGEQFYQRFRSARLDYGSRFQTVRRLLLGNFETMGELVLAVPETGYSLHPALLDGALQTCSGLTWNEADGGPHLSFAIDRVEIHRATTSHMWSWVRMRGDARAAVTKMDIDLADADGLICVRLVGVSTRIAGPASERVDSTEATLDGQSPAHSSIGGTGGDTNDGLVADGVSYAQAVDWFKTLLGGVLAVAPEQIDAGQALERYGIDSVAVLNLTAALKKSVPDISSTLFFEHRCIDDLVRHFIEKDGQSLNKLMGRSAAGTFAEPPVQHGATRESGRSGKTRSRVGNGSSRNVIQEDRAIAVIGLSGRYPEARSVKEFWENLKSGRDCIGEIPADRWPVKEFYHPDPDVALATGKSYGKWGGFVPGFSEFDCLLFGISPREAMSMDPQERLFLQTCWEVVEDAGYTRESLSTRHGSRVGVFAGITRTGYELYGPELWKRGESTYPRTSFASIANRVSYHLNLNGPSMPIDTMCSASLTAIHEACEHILRGECELAIAGGVNLYLHPTNYILLTIARMLSTSGRCRSFGEGGDGYSPGEGVGAVLLKRFSQAVADGDNIYGVIRGSSVNHGGKTNGFTVPNPAAQRDLIGAALRKAGVSAREVSYVEAHGTGTELGDPIEIAGLTQAFEKDTADIQFCALGSVKSNIGHAESAAGIAGVTKALLQMRYRQLVPSLHARKSNPHIDFSRGPFVLQQELAEWPRPIRTIDGQTGEGPRIAGISSFGAGGANAHVILEEYAPVRPKRAWAIEPPRAQIIVLSARSPDRLLQSARNLLLALDPDEIADSDLPDVAFTLQTGREAMEHRLALVASSISEVRDGLNRFLSGECDMHGIHTGRAGSKREQAARADSALDLAQEGTHADPTRLATAWVQGFAADWGALHAERSPRRLSLPTYPFETQSFWVRTALEREPRHETAESSVTEDPRTQCVPACFDESFYCEMLDELADETLTVRAAINRTRALDLSASEVGRRSNGLSGVRVRGGAQSEAQTACGAETHS
jgi:acyl transferase domain-containing protein